MAIIVSEGSKSILKIDVGVSFLCCFQKNFISLSKEDEILNISPCSINVPAFLLRYMDNKG